MKARARASLSTFMLLALTGCDDPVRAAQLAALGPEAPGVPPGPLHRPNQPCLVCHGEDGHATRLTVAGTVFRDPTALDPVAGAEVLLVDAACRTHRAATNCAGNFFVRPADYTPTMPL